MFSIGKLKSFTAFREVMFAISLTSFNVCSAIVFATSGSYLGSFRRDFGFGFIVLGSR